MSVPEFFVLIIMMSAVSQASQPASQADVAGTLVTLMIRFLILRGFSYDKSSAYEPELSGFEPRRFSHEPTGVHHVAR